MLLVHYLGILARELCARDLLPLALPAFSLQLATAECLVTEGSNPLCRLIHMRYACRAGHRLLDVTKDWSQREANLSVNSFT